MTLEPTVVPAGQGVTGEQDAECGEDSRDRVMCNTCGWTWGMRECAELSRLPELLRARCDGSAWSTTRTGSAVSGNEPAPTPRISSSPTAGTSARSRRRPVSLQTGAGWVAEEALATALLCTVRHADDPVGALARAATTSGESDSIACLTGAFIGAAQGMSAWPPEWADQIEYRDQLTALGRYWD